MVKVSSLLTVLLLAACAFGQATLSGTATLGGTATVGAAAALLVTDNFNRADGALGSDWANGESTSNPGSAIAIVTNQATGTASGYDSAYWAHAVGPDQYSQAKLYGLVTNWVGITVRQSGSNQTYYVAFTRYDGLLYVRKYTATTLVEISGQVNLVSLGYGALVDGDVLKLSATGSTTVTLTVSKNGTVVGTYTDSSSPLTTGAPGIWTFGTGLALDDWQGGETP